MAFFSKVIGIISDGPALPLFFFLYGISIHPSPISFISYGLFFSLFHEYGIKNIFKRHRPLSAGNKKGFSFPSSHAFASGLVMLTCLFFPLPINWLILLFAGLNAINRPILGVHYIADVIVGFTLGLLVAAGWLAILQVAPMLP